MLKLFVFIICTVLAIYVGGWVMKIVFASLVGWLIFAIGAIVAIFISA